MLKDRIPPEIRSSQEFQSAVIRLSIWAFMVTMIGIAGYLGNYDFTLNQYLLLFAVHLVWYTGLLISTIKHPQLWRARTYFSILADLSGTTGTLFLTGDATGPFYLLYAVSFLSQGMRYGARNLLLASLGSLLAFTFVAVVLGDWRAQPLEVMFVSLVLVVLPAYEYTLLRKLQKAKLMAEKANRARGDFLASMTHELRTPLSGVIGMARLLRRTEMDEEQREYLDSINSSADVLQALVGDILDLSKIDAGKLELKPTTFVLRDSLNETCWALSNQALGKGVELVCRVAPDVPEKVHGDELRFRQILFNLIGNAVKFTDEGHVRVSAELMPAGKGPAVPQLRVSITDSGIGISADRLEHVFDDFWQADLSSTRRHGGTGLGTAIARDLTRLMGGEIGVHSTEGQGSEFWVQLPLLQNGGSPPQAPVGLRGVRALVFENNPESADAIVEVCNAAAMHTEVVSDIDHLGALGSRNDSDEQQLALVVDTPQGLDLEQVGGLVHKLLGADMPMVYLHYPRRQHAVPGAAVARALKPVNAVQLWLAMETVIGKREGEAPEPGADAAMPAEGQATGRLLVAEDDAINAKLISSLLKQAGCDVTLVRDGKAALEAASTQPFDLAFIDLRMPRMDGLDFTRAFRAQERPGAHLPIVAITANAAEDARAACLRAGMDEFVTKPIDPQVLQELLLRYGIACQPS